MEQFTIPETMKAMTLTAYDKLELAAVPVPKPGPGEVLCRIKSVAICGSDPKMIHGDYAWTNWPPYYPFIMGHEWAGQIVALGEGVSDFKVGDRVAGEAHVGCGKCDNCKPLHRLPELRQRRPRRRAGHGPPPLRFLLAGGQRRVQRL